jgi:hypothetical protein
VACWVVSSMDCWTIRTARSHISGGYLFDEGCFFRFHDSNFPKVWSLQESQDDSMSQPSPDGFTSTVRRIDKYRRGDDNLEWWSSVLQIRFERGKKAFEVFGAGAA